MHILMISPGAHLQLAGLLRAKLEEHGISAHILCDDNDPQPLIEREWDAASTPYGAVLVLAGAGPEAAALSLKMMPVAGREVAVITVDAAQLAEPPVPGEFSGVLNATLVLIEEISRGVEPHAAFEHAQKIGLPPSHFEILTLMEAARHRLAAVSDRDQQASLRNMVSLLEGRDWDCADKAGVRQAYNNLHRLVYQGGDSGEEQRGLDAQMALARELAAQGQFEKAREVLGDVPDTPGELQAFKRTLAGQIKAAEEQRELRLKIDPLIQRARALMEAGEFHRAHQVISGLPDTPQEAAHLKQQMLAEIEAAQSKYAYQLRSRINAVVEETKQLAAQGQFAQARQLISNLPDRPEEVRTLKRNLLGQLGEAEERHGLRQRIDAAAEEARKLVARGEFEKAHWIIDDLPDNPEEVHTLKLNLHEQIYKIERQYGHRPSSDWAAGKVETCPPPPVQSLRPKEKEGGIGGWLRQHTGLGKRASGPAQGGPQPRTGQPAAPFAAMDRVHFLVTSPPWMKPGSSYVVDVWAHLEQQRQQVIERAREEAGGAEVRIKSKGPIKVERGTILTVRLQVQDLVVTPVEDTILWEGEIGNATFAVTVAGTTAEGSKSGLARIYVNGFQVAEVCFAVEVGSRAAAPERLKVQEKQLRSAFVSYASEDEEAVLVRVQALCKALPGLNVFFARKDLRSGEKWQDRLAQEIAARDIMYLFWSRAASVSQWVEWEWRKGLETRGIDFIDPFPLVSPEVVPPPRELGEKLHFGDWELAYLRAGSGK